MVAKKGIPTVDIGAGWQRSVAELGVALTLSTLRNVAAWQHRFATNTEVWPIRQFAEDHNFVNGELHGKQVGIFGFGRIGQHYGKLVRAFGAVTAAYDNKLPDPVYAQHDTQKMSLDQLIAWSEILCIAASPTDESAEIINRERIYKLRRGAQLIVISRTRPLDMTAVRERIRNRELGGGFDVFDQEPLPAGDELRFNPNVTLTPHIGGKCAGSNTMMADLVVEGFRRALER